MKLHKFLAGFLSGKFSVIDAIQMIYNNLLLSGQDNE